MDLVDDEGVAAASLRAVRGGSRAAMDEAAEAKVRVLVEKAALVGGCSDGSGGSGVSV